MLARSISSSFAAKRRMISSGGTGGGSGLLTGMGAGSVAREVGVIGPASCARAGTIANARSAATAGNGAMLIERRFIMCASIHKALDAILGPSVASVFRQTLQIPVHARLKAGAT